MKVYYRCQHTRRCFSKPGPYSSIMGPWKSSHEDIWVRRGAVTQGTRQCLRPSHLLGSSLDSWICMGLVARVPFPFIMECCSTVLWFGGDAHSCHGVWATQIDDDLWSGFRAPQGPGASQSCFQMVIVASRSQVSCWRLPEVPSVILLVTDTVGISES